MDGETVLGGGGVFGFGEERFDLGGRGGFVGELHAHHEKQLFFTAAHGEDAVGRGFGERLAPFEVVFELRGFGRGVFAEKNFGGDDGVALVDDAEAGAGVFVVADALGDDVAGSGEGFGGVLNFRFLVFTVVGGVVMTDEFLGLGDGIGGVGLGEDQFGEGLEALFFGDGGSGSFFRTERKIDVLEDGE